MKARCAIVGCAAIVWLAAVEPLRANPLSESPPDEATEVKPSPPAGAPAADAPAPHPSPEPQAKQLPQAPPVVPALPNTDRRWSSDCVGRPCSGTSLRPPEPALLDMTVHLPAGKREFRGGVGVQALNADEAGMTIEVGLRVAITDWLMYVAPLGLSGSIRHGDRSQTVIAATMTGIGVAEDQFLTSSYYALSHVQAIGDSFTLTPQVGAALNTAGDSVALGPLGGSLTLHWQPLDNVLVSLGVGATHQVAHTPLERGLVQEPLDFGDGSGAPYTALVLGSVGRRPMLRHPLIQVMLKPELSLYLRSTVWLAPLDDIQVHHRHVIGVSWNYGWPGGEPDEM